MKDGTICRSVKRADHKTPLGCKTASGYQRATRFYQANKELIRTCPQGSLYWVHTTTDEEEVNIFPFEFKFKVKCYPKSLYAKVAFHPRLLTRINVRFFFSQAGAASLRRLRITAASNSTTASHELIPLKAKPNTEEDSNSIFSLFC